MDIMREFINYMESKKENANNETKLLLIDLIIRAEETYSKLLWDAVPKGDLSRIDNQPNMTQNNQNMWENSRTSSDYIDNINRGNLPF